MIAFPATSSSPAMIAILLGYFSIQKRKRRGRSRRVENTLTHIAREYVYNVRSDCVQNNDDFRKGNADQ